jgi:rhodanese-related sulfurtransferase
LKRIDGLDEIISFFWRAGYEYLCAIHSPSTFFDMEAQIKHYENKLAYEIDSWDAHQAILNNEKIRILDVRSPEAYANEHIPVAQNFHHRTMNEETVKRLDPSYTYVTYCDGIGCNASTKGAYKLAKLGIRVKELIGGLEWWKRDGYATEGLFSQQGISCHCD